MSTENDTRRFRLYNSLGCDIGVYTAEELVQELVRAGSIHEGDTIRVEEAEE